MSDGIDQAANAFQVAMNEGNPAPRQEGDAPKEAEGLDFGDVFGNFNQHTDNSEPVAGGDEAVVPGKKAKKPAPKVEATGEDDDELTAEERAFLAEEEGDGEGNEDGDEADEGDGEGNEGDDEGEGDDGDTDMDQKFLVQIDGEEAEVTLQEALNGYIRTETFHKRMAMVDEGKKILSAEAAKLTQARDLVIQQLEEVEALSASLVPAEPDWDKLFAENPVQARALQKQYQELTKKIEETRAMRMKAIEDKNKADAEETKKYAASEFDKFIKLNPRIRTQADLEKEIKSMHRTARAVGFEDSEIFQVYDSRMLRILQKASKYDRMMASKPKPVNPNAKGATGKPTKANTKQSQERHQRQQQRLRRTGNVDDAAAVFQHILSRG
ncbi:head scaffolding protein [Ochrobactrum phage vB_OspP_OH]|uniref:Non-structural protein NSP1-like n=1 Tax=Ochrobactrum phage vB_OspP_OH TaxID=2712957 RepID=A0A6G6XXT1_9CAUD|nr:head scaffolding protein [Ochrobactrum phage vB_OspP_OH]QIG66111.1 non-structural protein NSP1-like [Ochrobactrum phage vB_OspP_OH]